MSGQIWAYHRVLQSIITPLQCESGVLGPALEVAAWLGRWFVGGAVLPLAYGDFQRSRQQSATTAHRALPVCEWSALGITWGTARSNADSSVLSRCGGAHTGGCGRAGQVVYGGCSFATLWRLPEGSTTRQPQRTEPCQCMSGQPRAFHGALQGQMQPLQCRADLVGPAAKLMMKGREGGSCWGGWFCRIVPEEEEEAVLGNHSAQSTAIV